MHQEKVTLDWRPPKHIRKLTQQDIEILWQSKGIDVSGQSLTPPISNLSDLRLPKQITSALQQLGFNNLNNMQSQIIPSVLLTRNVISLSSPNSGKTTCIALLSVFLSLNLSMKLPLLFNEGPFAVILLPSKEMVFLAAKIIRNMSAKISENQSSQGDRYPLLQIVEIVGGESMKDQSERIRKGCHIVVATPGRLAYLLDEHQHISLSQCELFCLESDRLIKEDFQQYLTVILKSLPKLSVKSIFVNKDSPELSSFIQKYMQNIITVSTKQNINPDKPSNSSIEYVSQEDRLLRLLHIIQQLPFSSKSLIVCSTRHECEDISFHLSEKSILVCSLTSHQQTKQRRKSLEQFQNNNSRILVVTELAAMSVPLEKVTHIINYGLPQGLWTTRINYSTAIILSLVTV